MTPGIKIKPTSNLKTLTVINLWRLDSTDSVKCDPEYQTELRWTLYQKQLFIDSLVRGIDIPKLYFDVRRVGDNEIFYVVDGQQRINAIIEFIDNQFPLLPDADNVGTVEVAGKTYGELDTHFSMMHVDNRNLDIFFLKIMIAI